MGQEALVRRRTGRPEGTSSRALDQHVLDTAARLFIEHGYAGTSVEQIASAAGAGKQTIYRRYPSKEDLFKAVITALTRQMLEFATVTERTTADPLSALREVCRAAFQLASKAEAAALYRVLIAEARRFPALIDHTTDGVVDPFNDIIGRLLNAAAEAGQITREHANETTVHAISGLFTGWVMKQALLGRISSAQATERSQFFENAWNIFLNGVRPAP